MNITKSLYIAIFICAFTYLAISLMSSGDEITTAALLFDPVVLLPVLGLTLLNYVLRFIRWEFYLRSLDIKLKTSVSLKVFGAGLIMVISPGKIGELIKAWLIKQEVGIEMVKTLPVVFMERLFDLIGLLILAGLGLLWFDTALVKTNSTVYLIVLILAALIFLAVMVLLFPPLARPLLHLAGRLPLVGRLSNSMEKAYEFAGLLLKPSRASLGVILSTAAWVAECAGLYVTVRYGLEIAGYETGTAVFSYSVSTLAGVVSPGGLGITDLGLVAFLNLDMAAGASLVAAFVIRLATLWFAVFLGGIVVLFFYRDTFKKATVNRIKSDSGEQNL